MAFDRNKYWKLRNNEVEEEVDGKKVKVRKPLRGQGDDIPAPLLAKESKVQMGFTSDGQIIVKNRAYRRRPLRLPTTELDQRTKNRLERRRKNKINKRRKY